MIIFSVHNFYYDLNFFELSIDHSIHDDGILKIDVTVVIKKNIKVYPNLVFSLLNEDIQVDMEKKNLIKDSL